MQRKQIQAEGIVTYWTTSDVRIDKLRKAILAIDPKLEKFIPEESTPMSALRRALEEVYPKFLVRKLDRKVKGFAVVKEDRGQKENEYECLASGWFKDNDTFELQVPESEKEKAIRAAYKGRRNVMPSNEVGMFLGRILEKYVGGVQLRPTGGIYWIPGPSINKWREIAEAFEGAAVSDQSLSVYVIRHAMDEDAIRAVHDALVNEVTIEANHINEQIISGELGARALKTREAESIGLIEKVTRYEKLLGQSLADVRKSLDTVKNAAAVAALAAATEGQEEAPVKGD